MSSWRQAGLYLASSISSAALGFAATALFTRLYAPAEYGVYFSANAVGGILSAMLFTWVRLSVLRIEARQDGSDIRATALICYGVSAAFLVVLGPLLHVVLHLTWTVAFGACLFAGTIALFELQLEILRARQSVRAFALASTARAVLMMIGGCILAGLGFGGLGLSLAIGFAYAAVSLGLAPAVWKGPVAGFDLSAARAMARFGVPATLSALALALHAVTDRLFIIHLLGHAMGGQYGVAADFTRQLVLVPTVALGSALVPAVIARHAAEGVAGARRQLVTTGEMLLGLLLPLVVGLALVGPQLAEVMLGEQFRETAAVLIPILSFVWLCQALSQNYVHMAFHLSGRSGGMVTQSVLSLAVNFTVIVPATWWFGITGAAGAVLTAEAVGLLAGFALARRDFDLPFPAGGVARVVGATAAMALAVWIVGRLVPPSADPLLASLALAGRVLAGMVVYGLAGLVLDIAGIGTQLSRRFGRDAALRAAGGRP